MTLDSGRDASAFDRFGVVAFGTPEVVAAVERIRGALPPSGRPILPAHVTVKGTFVDPIDLDQVVERVRACAAAAPPVTLSTSVLHVWGNDVSGTVVFEVDAPPAFAQLHWKLVEVLDGLATTRYHGEDSGVYTPHLTVVQEIPPEAARAAVPVIERMASGFRFDVTEIALVGRRAGTVWETLTTFPLGNVHSS
jgi:2'-5' RNA ligase